MTYFASPHTNAGQVSTFTTVTSQRNIELYQDDINNK